MKTTLILNPAAGAGRSTSLWHDLQERFINIIGEFELKTTGGAKEATEITREAILNGAERIIAIGGDGTWHETAEGYLSTPEDIRQNTILGCYPAGSGCDFARHMNFPKDPGALLGMLKQGKVKKVDVVKVTYTTEDNQKNTIHLTNMAAFGLGGEVAYLVDKTGKGLGGTATYLLATLGLLAVSEAKDFDITLDGIKLKETKYHSVILANTSTTGGGMKVAPEADCEDGEFEVVTFGDMGKWDMLKKFPMLYSGEHIGKEGVGLHKAKKMEVKTGSRARLNIDGEPCGLLPATFEIMPKALPVIAP